MRILSIDFDYFINTDIDTRNNKFPDGVDEKPISTLEKEWKYMYDTYPEIKEIGVIDSFYSCLLLLESLKEGKVIVSDSHKEISKLFQLIDLKEELEVIHIDFHHDNYVSGGNTIDCANWVRHLKDLKPDTDIKWYRREDSETVSLMGEYPYNSYTDLKIKGEFDYIFLCFSPEWTPPHLRPYFNSYIKALINLEFI